MTEAAKAYTLHYLRPPAPSVVASAKKQYLRPTFNPSELSFSATPFDIFLHALYIRKCVFVAEQQCCLDAEVDHEDSKSFHWLIAAIISDGHEVAAGTIRLVTPAPHLLGRTEPREGGPKEEGDRPLAHGMDAPDMSSSTRWNGEELYVKIGRLATLQEFRGRGYGRILVQAAVEYARTHPGEMVQSLRERKGEGADEEGNDEGKRWKGLVCAHAQKDVLPMYQKLGFGVDEGMGCWWEEGIEHAGVWKRVKIDDDGND